VVTYERWSQPEDRLACIQQSHCASFKTKVCCWAEFFFPLLLKIIENFVLGLMEHSVFRHCSFCTHAEFGN